jgi:preprotein translocase subunit SecE
VADKDEAELSASDADGLPPELAEADDSAAERSEPDLEAAPAELETAGVGAGGTVSGRSATRKAAPQPKGTPTAKRDAVPTHQRTTPVAFAKQSIGELRKVVYPTGQQLGNYFVVVLVFVLFIIAFVSLLDLGLGKLVFALFS